LKVWLAVPLTVLRDVSPKLLWNENVPFLPTVFFTTVMDPSVEVSVKVQTVVAPATTVMAASVPLLQLALPWVHPAGTIALMPGNPQPIREHVLNRIYFYDLSWAVPVALAGAVAGLAGLCLSRAWQSRRPATDQISADQISTDQGDPERRRVASD